MKKFIISAALLGSVLLLQGCPTDGEHNVTVDGQADLNLQDNLTQCEVRQNGTTYFVRQTGMDAYTFAFDPSIVYDDAWIDLTLADAQRVTPLTQTELDIINGTL